MTVDPHAWIAGRRDFFARGSGRRVLVARAPGRLDVMGGIADYSGSLVLELPLDVATWVAAQEDDASDAIVIETEAAAEGHPARRASIPLAELLPSEPLDYGRARALLTGDPTRAWSAYVAGALVVLAPPARAAAAARRARADRSEVPIGKGVSSSAALDVAAFETLAALADVTVDDRQLALAAQMVENLVVGAPCGVMDQMTAACGRRDHLLALLCQPAEIVDHLPLPPGLEVHGIDSGIRHAVAGADYGSVRAAAFMGYRIVAAAAGLTARATGEGRVAIDDQIYDGYLANVPPAVWRRRFRDAVPERIDGATFLARYQGIDRHGDGRRSGAQLRRARRHRTSDLRTRAHRALPRPRGRWRRQRRRARRAGRADVRIARQLFGVWARLRRHRSAGGAGAGGRAGSRHLRREDHGGRQRRHRGGAGGRWTPRRHRRDRRSLPQRDRPGDDRVQPFFERRARHRRRPHHALTRREISAPATQRVVEGGSHASSYFARFVRRHRAGHRRCRLQ